MPMTAHLCAQMYAGLARPASSHLHCCFLLLRRPLHYPLRPQGQSRCPQEACCTTRMQPTGSHPASEGCTLRLQAAMRSNSPAACCFLAVQTPSSWHLPLSGSPALTTTCMIQTQLVARAQDALACRAALADTDSSSACLDSLVPTVGCPVVQPDWSVSGSAHLVSAKGICLWDMVPPLSTDLYPAAANALTGSTRSLLNPSDKSSSRTAPRHCTAQTGHMKPKAQLCANLLTTPQTGILAA